MKLYLPSEEEVALPLVEGVRCGFPSPAEDFSDMRLNITEEIVKNPASTFYARVSGNSMINDGIGDGDILVVDKSVDPYDGCIAICFVDGEFTLKHVEKHGDHILLVPGNKKFKTIRVTEDNHFTIWGIVRYVIKKL
ncbi:MAG TPA: translesion error-prone DNA polymerase V autoproteolytic subunit [Bacteroidales bacterium]|nr:MAG: LexA repressor [Bacteroidetes bacterium ADurb.Bin037]HPV88362.1 translesion error-prone DNA polymerase V autoproteolytic subunit [Bacteroidales bacterium]HPW78428.1 translesion error-prone DNA polymerase V autoproteolytic subunit [Bacteroidales bacterium]HQB55944.1 translesion error-prone DNA polymerase V autoproteolytic subunit [Bacteroidales bacterium]